MTTKPQEQTLADVILKATLAQKPETVNQLASLVHDRLPNVSDQQILDAIAQLQREGKLKLTRKPQQTPLNLKAYLKTFNSFWYWTILIVTFATVAAVFTIPENLQPYVIIRYVLGTTFILWLPGYTFIKALFPKTHPPKPTTYIDRIGQNLDPIERTALSIGMSLSLVPIVGLLLNYTPFGIRLTPITLSLTALTIIFATTALLRENQNHKKQAPTQT